MTGDSIYMNYVSTLEKAGRLEELAYRLNSAAGEVEEKVSACAAGGWEGSARDAFLEKNRRAADKMRTHARKLERCAEMLRYAAFEYYRLEMAAQSIFGG